VRWVRGRSQLATIPVLLAVAGLSAFLNNTPVVVMFLPILSAIAATMGKSSSRVLMPLSFMAILGGMTTLIGSSTNLLVADYAAQNSDLRFDFFSFTPIGIFLAATGSVYVLFIMPRLLKPRKTMADEITGSSGKQFIAQIEVTYGHPLVGVKSVSGMFPALKDMTVRLVQRGEQPILPPFENVVLSPGDTVIVAATRTALANALARRQPLMDTDTTSQAAGNGSRSCKCHPGLHVPRRDGRGAGVPHDGPDAACNRASHAETGCVVMGIQRRSRMPRMAMNNIRLEAGDVLLVGGTDEDIARLRGNRDVLLLDWSTAEVPRRLFAPRALAIFGAVVAAAASGLVPIVIHGARRNVCHGCLRLSQCPPGDARHRQPHLHAGRRLSRRSGCPRGNWRGGVDCEPAGHPP
jgi:uncharacterized protein with PhoU and TrkA domain